MGDQARVRRAGVQMAIAASAVAAVAALPTGADAAPSLKDSFESRTGPPSTSAVWNKVGGRPAIVRGRSAAGSRSLKTPRARGAHYLERQLDRPAKRLSLAFSFRRARPGISGLVRFPGNRLTLTDDGRGRLKLVHRGRKIAAGRVKRAGNWNRVKIQLDTRRDRVRVFLNGSSRGRWIRVRGLRPERRIRLGTPNATRGPVWFDAVNRPTDADTPEPSPPAAETPAPERDDVVTPPEPEAGEPAFATAVSIDGTRWLINGQPANPGSASEGTLQSARLVQGIWDDENPDSRGLWDYSDGPWDPERNVADLIAALPTYADNGLNAITLSLQGGSPTRSGLPGGTWEGTDQTPIATGFTPDGALKPEWRSRAERAIEAADANGLVVILTAFYFGQADRLDDEDAARRASLGVTEWLRDKGYTNVVLEIGNEMGAYDYGGFRLLNTTAGLPGLIGEVKQAHPELLVTASHSNTRGRTRQIDQDFLDAIDVLLIHGNSESDDELAGDVEWVRERFDGPVHVNEDTAKNIDDDRFDLLTRLGVGNGFYDQTGFQSPPTVWSLDTDRKRDYFSRVRDATDPGMNS